ncbi:hypothetical protein HBI18_067960 [Parastagonospora nodorum]|nr:hypothetical protein HBI18_067960 [Parastagonospora nodorum]
MEQFNSIFEYLPPHCIAICKSHAQGIVQSQLAAHLNTKHPELVPNTRIAIIRAVQDEASLRQWAFDEGDVIYPSPATRPLPHLPVYTDGLQCRECGRMYRHLKRMEAHCREDHAWKGRPRGGRGPGAAVMWAVGVKCQKYHNTGHLGRLFEVDATVEAGPAAGSPEADIRLAVRAALSQAVTDARARQRAQNAAIEADTDRYEFQAWLNRAGWARHLQGLQRDWLLEMIQKPTPKERALSIVCWAAKMVLWHAQQASTSSVVGMPAMMYINRREFGNTSHEKPFNASQTGSTMLKYSDVWVQIIAYIWRTHALPVVRPRRSEDDDDDDGRRPPYRMTAQQKRCLERLQELGGEDQVEEDWFDDGASDNSDHERLDEQQEEELQRCMHEFMMSLLDQELGDDEYSSVLISAMAVLGIGATSGWLSPLVYTPKQSAIVTTSRMLVLYQSTKMRKAAIQRLGEEGHEEEEAAQLAPGHHEFVKDMSSRFMTLEPYGGKPTPMDTILRLRAFGFKVRFTTNAEGVIDWVGDTLLYGNIQFSMAQLRSMIHGTITSTRQQMLKDLMLLQVDSEGAIAATETPCPVIDWSRLVDNAAEKQVGWSFICDPRNRGATSVEDPVYWLGQRVGDEKRLRRDFVNQEASRASSAQGGGLVWVKGRIEAYGEAMKKARQSLAALVHMTGGAPPRGSELVTIQHKNSANGDSRGIFIEDGAVVFVTKYHKNIAQTGQGKVVHRYMPREVGEFVVFYLWFVMPFWEQLCSAVDGEGVEGSAYLWKPQPEKSWQQPARPPRSTQNDSTTRVGRRSRVRVVHQVVAEGESDEEGGEEEEEEVPVPGLRCTVELWNSNRVKHAIQAISLPHMGVKLTIMGWRHGSKGIYRRHIRNPAAVKAFIDADDNGESSHADDEAFDLQTGHSSSVAGSIYGRPLTEPVFSVEAKRFAFRLVSTEWHAFLQIPSALQKKPARGTGAAAARKEAIEEEYRRWRLMRLVDADSVLKRLLGEEAQFRSVQKAAIQAILQHKSPVVVVMGTGAGKSILFMLPASVSTGLTIVVVPLVALRFDMKERCDKLRIVSAEWDGRRPHESAQIMFVTPEAAVGEAFGQYINRQRAMGRLDRIVVDECHVVLDSLGGFRSRMLGLSRLLRAETQMVYLTATLQPREEQVFLDVMGLPPKQELAWFRGQTTRKNIRYRVVEYDVGEEEEAVVELVEGLKRKYPLPGQIIVYCGTVARTMQLAEALGAVSYHRTVGTAEQKKERVRQLTSGEKQVFTATNALGLGIDAPTIRAVVHAEMVRKMRQWAQESGRAGRDGQESEAIVMRGYRVVRGKRVFGKFGRDVDEEMQELLVGEGCMRVVMDGAMDGREDRVECEEDEAVCQRCEARQRKEGRWEEKQQEEDWAERREFEEQRKDQAWR